MSEYALWLIETKRLIAAIKAADAAAKANAVVVEPAELMVAYEWAARIAVGDENISMQSGGDRDN